MWGRGTAASNVLALAFVAGVALACTLIPAQAEARLERVRVSPGDGGAKTRFTVTFRTPVAAGTTGDLRRRYEINARPAGVTLCQAYGWNLVVRSRPRQRVRRTLRRDNGRRWCRGSHVGSVFLFTECLPGRSCAGVDTRPKRIGNFRFRVR